MTQRPLFDGVVPKPLPPLPDPEPPSCPMCGSLLDGSRCRTCDPEKW
jgi:hypothetical protein